MRKAIPIVFIMIAAFASAKGQTATDSTKRTVLTILAGPIFAPELHYYGRTDSLQSSALLPTVYLEFDSIGLYVNATSVFISDKSQTLTYAGTITEAGYKFGQKVKGFGGSVYGNKFFYNNTSQLPQSALKEQLGINLSYLDKYVNFTASGSVAFSNTTDGFASLGINHIFKKVKGKNIYLATPTFIANAGTQNFNSAFYQSGPIPIVPPQQVIASSRRFTVLDYELSVPLIYARNHFFFIATPSYILPVNIITVAGHPELSEKASDLFYVNLTVLYSFKAYKRAE
jgi:hypothetical protein